MLSHTPFALMLLMATVAPTSFGQADEHRHGHATHMSESAAHPSATEPDITPMLVQLPEQLVVHTLANMRANLQALSEIQEQIAKQNYSIASSIAEERLGMSALKLHGAERVAKHMPQEMRELGSTMHHAASKFALVAQESAVDHDMGKSVAALATLTQACVNCHASYRLR